KLKTLLLEWCNSSMIPMEQQLRARGHHQSRVKGLSLPIPQWVKPPPPYQIVLLAL
ncbi:hypothetical protein NDU88_002041, partial [Pleurodeles waltl]